MNANKNQPKLLGQIRIAIRTRHYSNRTEKTYIDWIKRFVNQAFKNGECSHITT
jgi:hypothetical protein